LDGGAVGSDAETGVIRFQVTQRNAGTGVMAAVMATAHGNTNTQVLTRVPHDVPPCAVSLSGAEFGADENGPYNATHRSAAQRWREGAGKRQTLLGLSRRKRVAGGHVRTARYITKYSFKNDFEKAARRAADRIKLRLKADVEAAAAASTAVPRSNRAATCVRRRRGAPSRSGPRTTRRSWATRRWRSGGARHCATPATSIRM
jgi:hypothetical protein